MPTYHKDTGAILTGIEEMWQGLEICLTTPKRSRVMRRKFGSNLPRMVDHGMSPMTLIEWYAGIAEAVKPETRFKLVQSKISRDSDVKNGQGVFDISGIYYPRGHLGDFSNPVTITDRPMIVLQQAI